MRTISSREFNQDVSAAKRFARQGPLFVTDRGKPTHVLLSIDAFRRLSGQQDSIVDLLAAPEGEGKLDPGDLVAARDRWDRG